MRLFSHSLSLLPAVTDTCETVFAFPHPVWKLVLLQEKDIYLLDDPLAAVDAHVARHLMQNCIMGLLRNKTCILCTHHIRFLTQADVVLVMEDGRIQQAGESIGRSVIILLIT